MNVVEAKAELTKILRPFRALEELEDVLAVAVKLDSERIGVTRAVAKAKEELVSLTSAKEVADREYADRQAKIEAGMKALRAQYQAQEASYNEQTSAVREKLDAAQRELASAQKANVEAAKAAVAEAAKRTADLEREYASRKSELEAEESTTRARLDSTKAALAALLQKVS